MKHLLAGLLIIILSICVFTGCSDPVGSISDSSGNGGRGTGFDDFYIIALKDYILNSPTFEDRVFRRRSDHVKIFGKVDLNDSNLIIEIFTDPVLMGNDVPPTIIPPGYSFVFGLPGDYILRGTFNNMTDEHPFKVSGDPPQGGDGSAGVGVVWLP